MSTNPEGIIGHITIRVPVIRCYEAPTLEDPGAEYLEYGTAELIEQDLSAKNLAQLSIDIDYGDVLANFEMPPALTEAASAALDALRSSAVAKVPGFTLEVVR